MISKLQTKMVNTFLNKMTTRTIASNWNAIIENKETDIARKKRKWTTIDNVLLFQTLLAILKLYVVNMFAESVF